MNYLWRFLLQLFSFLFIFPAILFSILVLALTDSWESGTVMLVSALILKIVVHIHYMSVPTSRRKQQITPSHEENSAFEALFDHETPPPLSDIYREIDARNFEKDVLTGTSLEREYERHPYDDRSFSVKDNRTCQFHKNCKELHCKCCDQCPGLRGYP
jgi:hypothetical protein